MFALLKDGLQDFRVSYPQHLLFAYLYLLLTSWLFVPLISYIFNRLLLMIGSGSLLNTDVYNIGLSYPGILGMLFIGFLFVIVLFIQFGAFIIIAQKRYFKKEILISEAFITILRKTPQLLGFGVFQLMFLLFLTLPFIDSPLSTALIDLNIPIFITSKLHGSTLSMIVYGSVFLVIVYLILRWIFILHYIILEGKSIRDALQSSVQLTKSNKFRILLNLFLLNATIAASGFVLLSLLSLVPSLVGASRLGFLIEEYLLVFSSFSSIILALVFIPINIVIITRLFYQFNQDQGRDLPDQLLLRGSKRLAALEQRSFRFLQQRKYVLLLVLLIYLTGMFLLNDNLIYLKWNVEVAAHRGDSRHAPENSMSSIRSALEKGVDAVEIDVQLTKDGVVVLNHDGDLSRVANVSQRVIDLTHAEIAQIDIGSGFSPLFQGEQIPTLEEVLWLVKSEEVKLIIDFKLYGSDYDLAEKVVELIERYELEEQCYIQAFDSQVLQEVRRLNSEIKIGQIMYMAAGNLSARDVDFYTIHQSMLSERLIQNAHKDQREVWVWTVNVERNIREVLTYDVDGIITDYPERVQRMSGLDL